MSRESFGTLSAEWPFPVSTNLSADDENNKKKDKGLHTTTPNPLFAQNDAQGVLQTATKSIMTVIAQTNRELLDWSMLVSPPPCI